MIDNSNPPKKSIDRRNMLRKIGLTATALYIVPGITTLSTVSAKGRRGENGGAASGAANNASGPSGSSPSASNPSVSSPSASGPSCSTPSGSGPSEPVAEVLDQNSSSPSGSGPSSSGPSGSGPSSSCYVEPDPVILD